PPHLSTLFPYTTLFRSLESANDACGRARQLATNQAGCASQFISNCVNARTQLVTARIATPSIILQRLNSCHADCNLGQSLAPGTDRKSTRLNSSHVAIS